jgi:hypothetical protein
MRTRDHYLARDETLSDSQTKTIDLKGVDPISAIEIQYEATNGATSNVGVPLHKDVDKIEVVDGSDVLFSLSGPQLAALNFYETGRYPFHDLNEGAAAVQKETFTIHWGRKIGDQRLYLDPARFTNPQLKLTHSLTISATAGFATGTGKLTAIAKLFDEKPAAPDGFLMSKDHYDWTTVASGDEPVTLPTDWAYRLLLIRGYESGIAWDTDITKVKLSLNNDKIIPFDLYADDLIALNEDWFGVAEIVNKVLRADNATPESFIAVQKGSIYHPAADFNVGSIESITADLPTLALYLLSATPTIAKDTTARAGYLRARGIGPHNVLAIPFGDMQDPDTWLKAPDFSSIKLFVTQGGAGATASILLQQLRKY